MSAAHEPNHAHIQSICNERDAQLRIRDTADEKVKGFNRQLEEQLAGIGKSRLQLISGWILQLIQPKPRKVIVHERLLERGVDPAIIAYATLETPVTPFIRVDKPTPPAEAEEAAPATPGPEAGVPHATPTGDFPVQ